MIVIYSVFFTKISFIFNIIINIKKRLWGGGYNLLHVPEPKHLHPIQIELPGDFQCV